MKLSDWAKKQGISYRTAWRWFNEGKLPVEAEQTPTGTILIKDTALKPLQIAIYARVSSSDQKNDLDRQISRLVVFANSKKWLIAETVVEIGSALNGHRSKLKKLLLNPNIKIILVEHTDRLMRFGIEFLESALASQGRMLVVMDKDELKDDLVQDMIEVLTSFCARLYGRRSAKNRAKKALECIQNENQ
jgi:putative resolvase